MREPLSERNSNVILKAHMPLLVALVPSPNDQSPMNAFKPTDILDTDLSVDHRLVLAARSN